MKTAVITGGKGFVGGRLTKLLLNEGFRVKLLTRGRGGPTDNPLVETVGVDYNDIKDLQAALKGADCVFHLAAAIFAFNKEEFYKANVEVTKNLCKAVELTQGLESFVYLSSQAAAGPSEYKNNPIDERAVPAPVSDYGETKLEAEKYVMALPEGIRKTVIRAPVVYGKNDSGVSKIAAWVARGIMVNTSSSEMFFNFVYVEDLVKALYTASVKPEADKQTFFVCEPSAYSWKYFINTMADAMDKPKPIMFSAPYFMLEAVAFVYESIARVFSITPALNYDKIKEAAIKGHWVCSSQKWAALTGQQFTPLAEGLKKTFNDEE